MYDRGFSLVYLAIAFFATIAIDWKTEDLIIASFGYLIFFGFVAIYYLIRSAIKGDDHD